MKGPNMSKGKGKIGKIISFFVILIILLLVAAVFFADHLTKVGVETTATQAIGTQTTLNKADLSFMGGSLTLEELQIANPPGYETKNFLDMTRCFTNVNIPSLLSDTITVETIKLEGLTLMVEQKGLSSNLKEILDNIQKKNSTPAEKPEPEKTGGKKLLVKRIEITDACARVKLLPIPGKDTGLVDIKLAPIVLEDISNDRNQAEMAVTVVQKVLLALAGAVVEQGGNVLPADLQNALNGSIKGVQQLIGGTAGAMVEEAGKVLGEGQKTIEKTGEELKKALELPGNLLKPKEKKEDESK